MIIKLLGNILSRLSQAKCKHADSIEQSYHNEQYTRPLSFWKGKGGTHDELHECMPVSLELWLPTLFADINVDMKPRHVCFQFWNQISLGVYDYDPSDPVMDSLSPEARYYTASLCRQNSTGLVYSH